MPAVRHLRLLVGLLVPAALAAGQPAPGAFTTGRYPNLFASLLGKSDAEIQAKVEAAWRQLFYGNDETQRIYYPAPDDTAYVADIHSKDVRTEGMSYGMMNAVQLDHRTEFDRIWKWAKVHMYHADGPLAGYFAWHCAYDGRQLDPGPASDGEQWFTMALLFAAHRWGNAKGIFDYNAEGQAILRTMLHHREADGTNTDMFNREARLVRFTPDHWGREFTDPSYDLPAFYELWARWAGADQGFWAEDAATGRAFFRRTANPRTGLMPDYANFDGTPRDLRGHGDFRFDAWRTLANVAVDHTWFDADPWQVEQSNRVLAFLARQEPNLVNQYSLDGRPLSQGYSPGLTAMAAVAGLAAKPDLARPFVQHLWEMPIPAGEYRYYDGLLYFLALLEVSGRFRIYAPAG